MDTHTTEMCSQCPFARKTPKTYLDTMGDNAERFAGQALGKFTLPCHMTRTFKGWRADPVNQTPCTGAAIYRTNCGYDHLKDMPQHILPMLPENKTDVFASPEELIAHHEGTSVEEAREHLRRKPLLSMLREELSKADVDVIVVPKE